jgi:hypothetical protein
MIIASRLQERKTCNEELCKFIQYRLVYVAPLGRRLLDISVLWILECPIIIREGIISDFVLHLIF